MTVRRGPIVCLDVDYRVDVVVAACVGMRAWDDATPLFERTQRSVGVPAEYEPGQFYKREMPYLLELLGALDDAQAPSIVVVDGYVHLDDDKLGLGARIHAQLGGPAVVGVAKHEFHGASSAVAVRRGTSKHPLFVGAIGIALDEAVAGVARMHGRHRIPTLLARVDRLSRT